MRNWLLKNAGLDSNTFKTLVLFLGGALEKYSNTFTTKHFEFVSISQHARKQHFHFQKYAFMLNSLQCFALHSRNSRNGIT